MIVCHTPHDAPEGFADKAQRCGARYTYMPEVNDQCSVTDMHKEWAEDCMRRSAARALGPCQPYELFHVEGQAPTESLERRMNYWAWRHNP